MPANRSGAAGVSGHQRLNGVEVTAHAAAATNHRMDYFSTGPDRWFTSPDRAVRAGSSGQGLQLSQVLVEVAALGVGVVDRPADPPVLVHDVRRPAGRAG